MEGVAWSAALLTFLVLATYETMLAVGQRRQPDRLARSAHATLRADWFKAVSQQKGSEILAVQTLRNSLMSATMTASTAVLGLMGAITLATPSLRASLGENGLPRPTPMLALELLLLALLFASLMCSAMAIRYYNHLGFISGVPVDSDARRRWTPAGSAYVRRAGILYSWGLHHLVLVAPIVASLLHPYAGPPAALIVVAALWRSERVGAL